jgi:hypothetical protein
MPIIVPNYNRKTDRLPFGTLIAIPRNPHACLPQSQTFSLFIPVGSAR